MVRKCSALTKDAKPCKGTPLPGRQYCMSHDPKYAEQRAEGNRKGGEQRANARRAARQWAAIGEQFKADDLPAILRACMLSVRNGTMEPSQAQAIASLARTSVTITQAQELEARIEAIEQAIGATPTNVRRLG